MGREPHQGQGSNRNLAGPRQPRRQEERLMIYLNGAIIPPDFARTAPADRGFTLADGLFETLRAYGGKPFRLADHLERLTHSADTLGSPLLFDAPVIADAVIDVLEANALSEAAIRITLTRGTGPRGLAPPTD